MLRFWSGLVLALQFSAACYAQDSDYFLSGRYTSDTSSQTRCDPEKDEGNYFILDRDGVKNFALKCDFLTFHIRPGDFETYLAVASCGDDTGITAI